MSSRLLRRVGVVLALLVVVALAAILAFSVYGQRRLARATERFEAALGPANLTRFTLPEVPDPDNAATWLAAGAGAIVLSEEDRDYLRRLRRGFDLGSADDVAGLERILARNAPALELLRSSTDCSGSTYRIDYERGPDAELPELLELLGAGRLVWHHGVLALAAGDGPGLGEDLEVLDRLAGSLANESFVITTLVALGVDRFYLDLVHRALAAGTEDVALLAEIEAALAGRDRRGTYRRGLAADGSMIVTAPVEQLLTGKKGGLVARLTAPLTRGGHRLLSARLFDEYTAMAILIDRPWAEIQPAIEERSAGPSALPALLFPNLVDGLAKLKSVESGERLALEAVRLWRARLAEGAYPEPLESPGPDPYSGQPVRVELRPDGTLVLEAPGALEIWRERNPDSSLAWWPRFTWVLPRPPQRIQA